jgi:hypothetical protein
MYENTIAYGRDELWKELAEKTTPELSLAMRELYSLYSDELIDWFAGLYDVEIGGYYYSQSARDNEKTIYNEKEYLLLPDAESTCQALGFWSGSGLADKTGGTYASALPEWMKNDIANYIYNLQDPDGYFYHPQWGKNISLSRRGRDFNWSLSMLEALGRTPKYPTILDAGKDDKKENEATLIPDHLSSPEKFAEYLENTNINEMSYNIGNQLSSQFPQIKAMGLDKQLLDFLDAHQHPESGHWHKELNYYAVNGIMKISGVYNAAGRPIPNAMAAARSAIFAITSDEQVNAVVDLWNTWIAVRAIVTNLRKAGDEASAAEIVKTLWDNAPAMIRKSREKIAPFQKEMGSFSYGRVHACPTSQGAPVTFGYQSEGDINATVISSYLLINSLFNALDIPDLKIPMFGDSDRLRYIELLEKRRNK